MIADDKIDAAIEAIREAGQVTAVLDGLSKLSASDLLHQFALAALPEIIRAHPKYSSSTLEFGWIADRAYEVARAMVDAGTRAEKEIGRVPWRMVSGAQRDSRCTHER